MNGTGTLFQQIQFNLSSLIDRVAHGQIGLPDLQRPFVWPNKKVRDLFDSMYRGYPVGSLLLWESGAGGARGIGSDSKQVPPQLLVIDGQQRLTSLYAVVRGVPVVRQNFQQERVEIAFCPLDGSFRVADAAVRNDSRWIPDISVVWSAETGLLAVMRAYFDGLSEEAAANADRRRIEQAIERLHALTSFPFTALQLSASLDEEQVSEVFVRINSKGTPLNQADFILTLMSVFRDKKRAELEDFCRRARVPSRVGEATPFNHFLEPEPDQLLRVGVGVGFRRARLQHVYSILRGKDLETGQVSTERREEQFSVLDQAQDYVLDLGNWKEFLKCLLQAGYRSGRMVSSRNALLYAYVFYLLGKRDFEVERHRLHRVIARWFFFVALTGRYTDSPETRMEQDLADLRGIRTADGFVEHLERTIASTFTGDYWRITLPGELATSAARSPALFAYYAALNLLDARALFSELRIAALLDPAAHDRRSALERHHLFPKAHLHRMGVGSRRDVNQIANFALVEWPDNSAISDQPPAQYFAELVRRQGGLTQEMRFWHALPEGWEHLDYPAFLEQRRRRIAEVIRQGFEVLASPRAVSPEEPAQISASDRVLEQLEERTQELFRELLEEPLLPAASRQSEVLDYLARLESLDGPVDLDAARLVADRCSRLLDRVGDEAEPELRHLAQAACLYFTTEDDVEADLGSSNGFADDLTVLTAVEHVFGADLRVTRIAG